MPEEATLLAGFAEKIHDAASVQELDSIEQDIFGRKQGALTLSMKALGALPMEEKIAKGRELNALKISLTEALEARKAALRYQALGSLASTDKLDVTLDLPATQHGHLHLIPEFIRQVEDVFGRMGFEVASGPEVETEENNFNLLNIPDTHPARDAQDTFWIKEPLGQERSKDPTQRYVLRTHTSPVQVRYMLAHQPPLRIICPGKVYRKDADATHSPMFHQFEGLMIGTDVSLANMKAVMMTAIRELIGDAQFRFRTGFFPFVEPGLEVDMRWQGDESQSREGRWLEIAGCGMVHPSVLRNCGIDADQWQGFAFGFGVERMLMIKHQIPDLRSFYQGDLRFLSQF
jgi:phenylalanyl-tRNA synthetase alpha chain